MTVEDALAGARDSVISTAGRNLIVVLYLDHQRWLLSFSAQPIKTIKYRRCFNQPALQPKFARIVHQQQPHH